MENPFRGCRCLPDRWARTQNSHGLIWRAGLFNRKRPVPDVVALLPRRKRIVLAPVDGGVKRSFDLHDVILIETMDLDDSPRRIGSLTP
jgi:hypothetical protein